MGEVTANSAIDELGELKYPEAEGLVQCKKIFMSVIGCLELLPRGAPAGDLFGRLHTLEPPVREVEGYTDWRSRAIGGFRNKLWELYPGEYVEHLEGGECACRSTKTGGLGAMVGLIEVKFDTPVEQTELYFKHVKDTFASIQIWLEKLTYPEGAKGAIANVVMSRLHATFKPPSLPTKKKHSSEASSSSSSTSEGALLKPSPSKRVKRTLSKKAYNEMCLDKILALCSQVWGLFPRAYSDHLKGCKSGCSSTGDNGITLKLTTLVPNINRREWCHHAIEYLERRYAISITGRSGWAVFVNALKGLTHVEGFNEAYLRHVLSCTLEGTNNAGQTRLCASWEILDAIASDRRLMSPAAIRDALHGLTRPGEKAIIFRPAVAKNAAIYAGCQILAPQIGRVADEKVRFDLMMGMVNAAAGLDKGRAGTREAFWDRDRSGCIKPVANPEELDLSSLRLGEYGERIIKHVERRVWFFFQLCSVVWGDAYQYTVRNAWCTYGTDVEGDEERCHSAVVSLVDRTRGNATELGSISLFHDLLFLSHINHTINLPSGLNQVDSHLERQLRKEELQPLLNRVSGAKGEAMTPLQATVEFVRLLEAELSKIRDMGGTEQEYVRRHLHALGQLMEGEGEARTLKTGFLHFCFRQAKGVKLPENDPVDFKKYHIALLTALTEEAEKAAVEAAKAKEAAKVKKAQKRIKKSRASTK